MQNEKSKLSQRSFTVLELLVITFIIALLTGIALPNYRAGDKALALQRTAYQLMQDLRRVQGMAVSSELFQGVTPTGYGVYLDKDEPTKYILFADVDGNHNYSGSSEMVEEINLENRIKITELSPIAADSSLTVIFLPPDPVVEFYPDSTSVSIALEAEGLMTTIYQYAYQLTGLNFGHLTPRAPCDISSISPECLFYGSLPASAVDPQTVYDQWWLIFNFSNRYEKQQTELSVPLSKTIQVNKVGLITTTVEDQCDNNNDCFDGNDCTYNDRCDEPDEPDSICLYDFRPDGFDCGDCRECQSGTCTYLCERTDVSCECLGSSDVCTDCTNSIAYPEECEYGYCIAGQRSSWSCSVGTCQYSCPTDPSCSVCLGQPDGSQVPGCDGICQACQGEICEAITADYAEATALGCTAGEEACRKCDSGVCGYYTSDQHNCSPGYVCNASGNCELAGGPWACGDLLDYGDQDYQTVQIGSQCWLAENLNVDPGHLDVEPSCSGGVKDCYNDIIDNCTIYGGLYSWDDMMCGESSSNSEPSGVRGICPSGWHIPSHNEITTLERQICYDFGYSGCDATFPKDESTTGYLGQDEGSAMAGNADLWSNGALDSDDKFGLSGFNLLPGGYVGFGGSFYSLSDATPLWQCTEAGPSSSWGRYLYYSNTAVRRFNFNKAYSASIRCVRD